MADNKTFTLMTGTLLGATTTGQVVSMPEYKEGTAILSVTATAGTDETADVIIEHSADNSVWVTHTTFTQATAATTEVKTMANFMQYVRPKFTIGGTATPTFTFTLKMAAKK